MKTLMILRLSEFQKMKRKIKNRAFKVKRNIIMQIWLTALNFSLTV